MLLLEALLWKYPSLCEEWEGSADAKNVAKYNYKCCEMKQFLFSGSMEAGQELEGQESVRQAHLLQFAP